MGKTDRAWSNPSMSQYEPADSESDGVECPTCERDDFTSEKAMKIHHARAHGESIAGATVSCAWCGAGKHVDLDVANRYDRHFCNPECKGEWQSKNRVGEDHPSYKGTEEMGCINCGELFRPRPYQTDDRKYCSLACHGEDKVGDFAGEDNPMWEGKTHTKSCSWCGDDFQVHEYKSDRARFCSKDCYGEWQSEYQTGENNPAWKGGGPWYYGPNWPEKRRECIERDDYRCQSCGMHENNHWRGLSVHHITPLRHFRHGGGVDYESANALGNLVTLCDACHSRWEKMAPLRPQTAD